MKREEKNIIALFEPSITIFTHYKNAVNTADAHKTYDK